MAGKRFAPLLNFVKSAFIIAVITWILGEIVFYFWTPVEIPLWGLHQPDPLLGYRMRPYYRGRHRGPDFNVRVRTNGLGLRGPELRPIKGLGKRILILGDSFVFGISMEEGNTIPGQLQACLDSAGAPGGEVINAGVIGYDNHQEIRFLESEGLKLQPDVVVWAIYPGNDLADNLRGEEERSGSIQMRFSPGDWLQRHSNVYCVLRQGYKKFRATSDNRQTFRRQEIRPGDKLFFFATEKQAFVNPYYQTADSLINKFADLARRNHFLPVILLIPVRVQYDPEHQDMAHNTFPHYHFDFDAPTQVLTGMARRAGLPCQDLLPDFRAYPRVADLILPLDNMHFSAAGYRLAGRLLYAFLQQVEAAPQDSLPGGSLPGVAHAR